MLTFQPLGVGSLDYNNLTINDSIITNSSEVKVEIVGSNNTEFYKVDSDNLEFPLKDLDIGNVEEIIIHTKDLNTSESLVIATLSYKSNLSLKDSQVVRARFEGLQQYPFVDTIIRNSTNTVKVKEAKASVGVVGLYGSKETRSTTNIAYESTFNVNYELNTNGFIAPFSEYVISHKDKLDNPLKYNSITLSDILFDVVDSVELIITTENKGIEDVVIKEEIIDVNVDTGAIDLTNMNVVSIQVRSNNLKLDNNTVIATVEYYSRIDMGSNEVVSAKFEGKENATSEIVELEANAQNNIIVKDTKTGVKVEGVNQVNQGLGVGNKYDIKLQRLLKWTIRGSNYSKVDYTLDQGYKSLGGFTTTLTRPTNTFENNDQKVAVDVLMPHKHFDLYYIKVREEMKPFIDNIEIYRDVDGAKELWKTVDGSDWVDNTQEESGFWRINTARPDNKMEQMYETHDEIEGVANHPYFKDAWEKDVIPVSPVTRVVVNLKFNREDNNASPQMSGVHNDIIEYMGRFHSTSEKKEATVLQTTDKFGIDKVIERSASTSINSLVGYSYAQSKTGAHDSTTTPRRVILMGNTGEYLSSIWNMETYSIGNYGAQEKGVFIPAATEHNEWLQLRNSGFFHDELVYEFAYPKSPAQDEDYNYKAQYFSIEDTEVLKYATSVRVFDSKGEFLEYEFTNRLDESIKFEYVDGERRIGVEDGKYIVSMGTDEHPSKIEVSFKEIQGFGENTAEIAGGSQDNLGASLNNIDIRIGGIVSGNKDLVGTTNLYRIPLDTKRKDLLHTSTAILQGYTPKLGSRIDMDFDKIKVYDYDVDNLTPERTKVLLNITNTNEADIKDVTLNFTPDAKYRADKVEIPAELYDGDWKATNVEIIANGKKSTENLLEMFTFNIENNNYELDLNSLFGKEEKFEVITYKSNYNDSVLEKRVVSNIKVKFSPTSNEVGLFGSITQGKSEEELQATLGNEYAIAISGNWVDPSTGGYDIDSMPTSVAYNTKGSNEVLRSYTSFNTKAELTSYDEIWANAGGGNNGGKPTFTKNSGNAPMLYNRISQLSLKGTHLFEDNTVATNNNIFYDLETDSQVDYTNIVVGDTTKVLYELNNYGKSGEELGQPGNTNVIDPAFHIVAPAGLKIEEIIVDTDEFSLLNNFNGILTELTINPILVKNEDYTITNQAGQEVDDFTDLSQVSIKFNSTLLEKESIVILVKYKTSAEVDTSTQNKTIQWNAYARPGYTHNYMSYDVKGMKDLLIDGTIQTINLDGNNVPEVNARIYNINYKYTNPNKLTIDTTFVEENLSGKEMKATISNIVNETLHSETNITLNIKLDDDNLSSFELTEFPMPTYPEGYTGEFDKPVVYFKLGEDWVNSANFNDEAHTLSDINELRVDYGKVSAEHNETAWEAPEFVINGIGHWKAKDSKTKKDYDIKTIASIVFEHINQDGSAKYGYETNDKVKLWKAIPTVEFNLQSFETKEEAQAKYDGTLVGKSSYKPGDTIWNKLSIVNENNFQGLKTDTPYGKADFLNPVIIDKVPEYLTTNLDDYIKGKELNIEEAISSGALLVRITGIDGETRSEVPKTVKVSKVSGLDVSGAQIFKNDKHNDGYGLLSSTEPFDTAKNPAEEISFTVFEYEFESVKRGETLEIIYSSKARQENLPIAKYADGRPVYAPLNSWYGIEMPNSTNAKTYNMDMAALLHDAGLTGDKGHEVESSEFLSNSHTWVKGDSAKRRVAANSSAVQNTYYDGTASMQQVHKGYLRENNSNTLYTGFTTGTSEESFSYSTVARVNDGKIDKDERILWTQTGMQLSRAWIYGASEMVPDVERKSHGTDNANFYEHDGSLNHANNTRWGYTPYLYDDYTYAVELYEEFTMKLHGVNLGDRAVEGGLEYTSILPNGITPYDEDGNIIGIKGLTGGVESEVITYEVVQTPVNDQGYRAPAQSQEARTHADDRADGVPYVVKVKVPEQIAPRFNTDKTVNAKYQLVEMRVRVYNEPEPSEDGISYWYDELMVKPIQDEEYYEIYDDSYGAFNRAANNNNGSRFPNDAIIEGFERNDNYYYPGTYLSFEPYGMYIRGLNAQAKNIELDGTKTSVSGDQIAMRKPTLRVWSKPVKDEYSEDYDKSIQNFTLDLYEEFTITSTVENQQLEVLGEYNRTNSGYNRYSGDNYNADIWLNAPQTIGGARGTYFEPTMTVDLPYGIVPVMEDGTIARLYSDVSNLQNVKFTATINNITYNSTEIDRDVSELFNVELKQVEDDKGIRFILYFTPKDIKTVDVAYGQSLVISPRVSVIDEPIDGFEFDAVQTIASTERPVFNPVVSKLYTTGSTPSLTSRDQASTYPYVKSSNGLTITQNDQQRLDSTTNWKVKDGVLKITDRLIKETAVNDEDVVYGETLLRLKKPTIKNTTKVLNEANGVEKDLTAVDAAGKYMYLTEALNEALENENPFEEIQTGGKIHNSKFVFTQYITEFAKITKETRIKLGDKILNRSEYEALGYEVELIDVGKDNKDGRQRVQFVVTTPENIRGTKGELKNNDSFKFLYEVKLVSGYDDDKEKEEPLWKSDELIVDSFISVITDDKSLIRGSQDERDFIIQRDNNFDYVSLVEEEVVEYDIDDNRKLDNKLAHNSTQIEIIKPRAEVIKNTTRPREEYSNGKAGDTYFNSSDVIEYMITYANNTGSGLKSLVVEDIIPTHESNNPNIPVSRKPINTSSIYVSTGKWELPKAMMDRLELDGKEVDDVFKTFVYISEEIAEESYGNLADWTLLNPEGTSILTNEVIDIPEALKSEARRVKVEVRALDPDNYLLPSESRLDIDADPNTEGKQEVTEVDPEDLSITPYPKGVTDNAIKIGINVMSDAKSTLHIYNTARIWGNYVGDKHALLDEDTVRSYLTPSRPIVNILYNTLYYRSDNTKPVDERFGWSDITTIAPKSSPHLKFRGEFINADDTMWTEEESNIYSADTLINPTMTFKLPSVIGGSDTFTYVPNNTIDETHPLSDDHRSKYSLTDEDSNQWTYRLIKKDGSSARIEHTDVYYGPWEGTDRNHVTVWFDGVLYPGDRIVVEFISEVDAYIPNADSEDLKSVAMITNNTGLLQPLNSAQNYRNKLGYELDYFDYNQNGSTNDRLVLAERQMFQYETYDDFGKRKIAFSDLNMAGTTNPDITPVSEGGIYSFETAVDNSRQASENAYPYPIIYDVLPHIGDTSIVNDKIARNSKFSGWLIPDSLELKVDGFGDKTYTESEYTIYVGPFTKDGDEIVKTAHVPAEIAKTQAFYEGLGLPSQKSASRDEYFVKLDEVKENEILVKEIESVLVLLNNAKDNLPGQSKMKLTYDMKAPINAPVLLQHTEGMDLVKKATAWNSFVGTQKVDRFIPQESNNAGVYITQQKDKTYLGNYVWLDSNLNGVQEEGTLVQDDNGRWLLNPDKDLNFDGTVDDPGLNEVKVTLLTETGNAIDNKGQAVKQDGDVWYVIDDVTGEFIIEEIFLEKIVSDGPMIRFTETDIHGNQGYYVFSNIPVGKYRVMYEFEAQHDKYSITTPEVFNGEKVEIYEAGVELGIPYADVQNDRLVAITEVVELTVDDSDEARMNFDIGIAPLLKLGGTIFKENAATLDGRKDVVETGIENYNVYLKDVDGNTVVDRFNNPLTMKTDENGVYEFTFLARDRQYYIEVTDENDEFSYETVVSPIIHNIDPLEEKLDNDGFTPKGEEVVKTNLINLPLEYLYETDYETIDSVSVGFYDKTLYGTIGNRVWDDLNRDGIQDEDEPGVAGQKMILDQYVEVDGEWIKTKFTKKTETNKDGYYYFIEVPMTVNVDEETLDAYYEVRVEELVKGYTITQTKVGEDDNIDNDNIDNDFYRNGTMHEFDKGDNLFNIIDTDNPAGIRFAADINTVDLGLAKHELSTINGEVFIDENKDGLKNDNKEAALYNVRLEVNFEGIWRQAYQDSDGFMVEPANIKLIDAAIKLDAVNKYEFTNLHQIDNKTLNPYEYRVVISEVPLWNKVTDLNVGEDTSIDNDFIILKRANKYEMTSNEYILSDELENALTTIDTFIPYEENNVDLGLIELAQQSKLSGRLWYDGNEDGLQDDDELPLDGMRVNLYHIEDNVMIPVLDDEGIQLTKITDENGEYEFEVDVARYDEESPYYNKAYEYVVEFNLLSRHTLSAYQVGSDDKIDSDFITLTASGYETSIADRKHTVVARQAQLSSNLGDYVNYESIVEDTDIDGGIYLHDTISSIGTTVYEDINSNGEQDSNEPGISGIRVNLYRYNYGSSTWESAEDVNGNSTLTTSVNGDYLFEVETADLNKKSDFYQNPYLYKVMVEAPANYRLVEVNNKFFYQGSKNVDGIEIEKPFSYVLTDEIQLINVENDVIELGTSKDILDINAGFVNKQTIIGGVVWNDTNKDGLRDDKERTRPNIEITLWRLFENEWREVKDVTGKSTTKTNNNGEYRFLVNPANFEESSTEFLEPYEYKVSVKHSGNENWTKYKIGDKPLINSNIIHVNDLESDIKEGLPTNKNIGVTDSFTIFDLTEDGLVDLSTVRSDVTIDVGILVSSDGGGFDDKFVNKVNIGGVAWDDKNLDGIRQDIEMLRRNQEVILWRKNLDNNTWERHSDLNGNSSQKTDKNGEYLFTVNVTDGDKKSVNYLTPYEYRVTVERLNYEVFSPVLQGDDIERDSNITRIKDSDLTNRKGLPSSKFVGISSQFDISDLDDDGLVKIKTVRDDLTRGLGIKANKPNAKIGGTIWTDSNFDGIRQQSEERRENVEVVLWKFIPEDWNNVNSGGKWTMVSDVNGKYSTTTDEFGNYEFTVAPTSYDEKADDYLIPYKYRTTIIRLGNESLSPVMQGDDIEIDSNFAQIHEAELDYVDRFMDSKHLSVSGEFNLFETNKKGLAILDTLRNDLTQDAGLITYKTTVLLGDYVWNDLNEDGIQDVDEEGLEGIEVSLERYNPIIDMWESVEDIEGNSYKTTDANGFYTFTVEVTEFDEFANDYLLPYEYRVVLSLHKDYRATGDNIIKGSLVYSQPAVISDLSQEGFVEINSLTDDLTLDFGLIKISEVDKDKPVIPDDTKDPQDPENLDDIKQTGNKNDALVNYLALIIIGSTGLYFVLVYKKEEDYQ